MDQLIVGTLAIVGGVLAIRYRKQFRYKHGKMLTTRDPLVGEGEQVMIVIASCIAILTGLFVIGRVMFGA